MYLANVTRHLRHCPTSRNRISSLIPRAWGTCVGSDASLAFTPLSHPWMLRTGPWCYPDRADRFDEHSNSSSRNIIRLLHNSCQYRCIINSCAAHTSYSNERAEIHVTRAPIRRSVWMQALCASQQRNERVAATRVGRVFIVRALLDLENAMSSVKKARVPALQSFRQSCVSCCRSLASEEHIICGK
jgi:hypothetical protein